MSIAASAENTMFKKVENENNNNNNNNNCEKIEIEKIENNATTEQNETTSEEIHDSDDDMIVITIRETYTNETNQPLPLTQPQLEEKEKEEKQSLPLTQPQIQTTQTNEEKQPQINEEKQPQTQITQTTQTTQTIQTNEEKEPQKKGEEFFEELKDEMESKKLFPLMPCNMASAFGYAMQHVEYLDITNAERKTMAIELVKCLAYSNNEHGARECFDYLFQNNMTDNIIKTIIDCTKDRYDINKYPHTNRNIVFSNLNSTSVT
jgi:hypothetical protein